MLDLCNLRLPVKRMLRCVPYILTYLRTYVLHYVCAQYKLNLPLMSRYVISTLNLTKSRIFSRNKNDIAEGRHMDIQKSDENM